MLNKNKALIQWVVFPFRLAYLLNIKILNVELCRWTIEDIKYDYKKLSKRLPYLTEFSLQTQHTLSFNQLLIIIQHLIYLKKLSFIYQNYDEHGIDIFQFESTINQDRKSVV